MKNEMSLPVFWKVRNTRLFSIGIRSGHTACIVMVALVCAVIASTLQADTHYVNAARLDDGGDGLSWATAEQTIQAAITASTAGDMIVVTNGVYAPISTANKAITIQSVNGAAVTIIDGGGTNRCATLGSTSTHLNTILIGFTLRNGVASEGGGSCYGTLSTCTLSGNSVSTTGGGSFYGTLNNCTLSGNNASSGGGAFAGTLNNCTLSGNCASAGGGGSTFGTLNNCALLGNSAFWGGGSNRGTLNNCTLSENSATYGGGSYNGSLNNCMFARNNATYGGGSYYGTLKNCTLTKNTASSGGGSSEGTLNNCIVWGNTITSGEPNNYYNGTFSYSCTAPLPSGTGNLSADPLFRLPAAGDFRLSPGSPCLNAGANGYVVGALDVIGNTRIQDGTVDMGAYEGAGTLVTDGTHLALNVLATGDTNGIVVSWNPPSAGGAVLYRVCRQDMAMGPWTPVSNWILERSFLDKRVFFGVTYRYAIVSAFDAQPDIISGLSAPVEGQLAFPHLYVDASRPSDAGDGRSWATAKRTIQGAIGASKPYDTILVTNGVYSPITTTNNVIMIRSVNGEEVTIIDGGGTNRCATLGSVFVHLNTNLIGFTLRNGYATSGGGSYYGTLDNCTLSGNSASYGGGSYYGKLNNCTLSGNSAFRSGGSWWGTLNNCTLSGNSASYVGGSNGGTLNNCTLSGNSASTSIGGSSIGTLNNCIVWGNTLASGVTNNYVGSSFNYSCTTPLPSGTGNISSNPLFKDTIKSNFLLQVGSPCINAGSNPWVVGAMDLAGNPRIVADTVDMGAYEMPPRVTVTFDANGGLLATGHTSTNCVGYTGDLYASWLTLFSGISRLGYSFVGWWTGVGGTGTQVVSETAMTLAADHTLYAKWVEDPYLCVAEGADPLSTVGFYEGFFYSENNFEDTPVSAVNGTLSLTVSTLTGKLSARANMRKGNIYLRQSVWAEPNPDADGMRHAVLTASDGEVLDLYIGQDRIRGALSGGSLGTEIVTLAGARSRFKERFGFMSKTLLDSFKGYYTVALPAYGMRSLGTADEAPRGTGYLALTVDEHGHVRIAGTLADGTKVSRSSHLILFDGCGPEACVPLFVPLYGRKGWIGGLLWIDPVSRTIVTDRYLGWFVRWEKPSSGTDGFSEVLDACGGFYSELAPLAAHYLFSAQTNNVSYVHSKGVVAVQPVFPTAISVTVDGTRMTMTRGFNPLRHDDVYDYAASENSSMATLTFQPATGIFKGGFKLYYDYTLTTRLQHRILSVLYSGVLTPLRSEAFDGLPAGQGYYLVPDNAPAVAPYRLKRSYLIELDDDAR